MRTPDFDRLLTVLRKEDPGRPTLFEFFHNEPLYAFLAGEAIASKTDRLAPLRTVVHAFRNAGYDYATVPSWLGCSFSFPAGEIHHKESISINEGGVIDDEESFAAYPWPDPDAYDYSLVEDLTTELPDGMKLIVCGPGGVLENAIRLTGYEDLCYLIADEPDLVQQIFDNIGSRILRYYEHLLAIDGVGAAIVNDDWGFKTQTMLAPDDMRRYVFPWHKKIVAAIHDVGMPAILHSCGNPEQIIDDVIDDMEYDGRHSYEDTIIPVEDAYDRWHTRIATLGGIDVDFICRSEPDAIYERSKLMLERSHGKGSYALGTGNSVPEYIPREKFLAMIRAAVPDAPVFLRAT